MAKSKPVRQTQGKPKKHKKLPVEVIRQMVTLSTSAFGLVAALAWNSVIQELVNTYIKTLFPKNSGLISLFIYAIIITLLAVFITFELSSLLERLDN
jgi:polyferredoxin